MPSEESEIFKQSKKQRRSGRLRRKIYESEEESEEEDDSDDYETISESEDDDEDNYETISETEDEFFCGTTSGDILRVGYPSGQFKAIGPEKNKYSLGVTAIQCLKNGDILAGSGDGAVMLLAPNTFKPKKFSFYNFD